jgi:16S rRNA (cytosine967-C5)-methyltransferase
MLDFDPMSKLPYRQHHLFEILKEYEIQNLPLDYFISTYFRRNKSLGPKDRAFLAEIIYGMVRWRGLLDYLCEKPVTWEKRWDIYSRFELVKFIDKAEIPLHIRLSFPKVLFDLIIKSHGLEKGSDLCRISNQPAPTSVRANLLKTTREALIEKWNSLYEVSCCKYSDVGIVFHKKINFFSLPEFKAGLFEVQDEGSQLLSKLVKPTPGELVMDYCAGSGGKTLAFAPEMNNKGQIYLHDIRPHILEECRKRLRRAGLQNAQTVLAEDPKLKKLKKQMDWVLVDAPCTGTGTMRRNPDMKWNFNQEMLTRLVGQQRMIFEKALSFLKPAGHIVYATCSILNEENHEQLDHFMKTYKLEVAGDIFQSFPCEKGMDGFFGAVLKFQSPKD